MRRLRSVAGRMSLRVRLTAIAVVLVGLGLVVAGVATHRLLNSFLVDRVDQQFAPAEGPAVHYFGDPNDPGAQQGIHYALPARAYAVLIAPGRTNAYYNWTSQPRSEPPFLLHAPQGISTSDGYRVFSQSFGPTRLVLAFPLDNVNSTLAQLAIFELVVGLGVLVLVGILAYIVIRRGLRPLDRIEDTAGAIAAGDLSRRVEGANPHTEVGRLGLALNAMLAQIEEAFREREASEERLRQFVGDASHELRTPLTSVRGYAELFRHGASNEPEDLAIVMRRIEAEAERMGVLVEDLLLLAKLDQGRPLEHELVDLSGMVAEMVSDHRMLSPEWPVEERIEPGVRITGDELRIRQAIGNLLSNARAHTPPGTRIEIAVTARDGAAEVEVADDGPGIPPEHAERVFERFFRADPSRTRASGGTGLGLSIVAAIAEAHGGRAEASSVPGEGSRFRLLLPIAHAADTAPAPPTRAKQSG